MIVRLKSPGAGLGPPPCVAVVVTIANAIMSNSGNGAKSAVEAGAGKGSK